VRIQSVYDRMRFDKEKRVGVNSKVSLIHDLLDDDSSSLSNQL